MCCTNDFCGTRRKVEWMLTPLLSVPVAMNFEIYLHLNSELASNEFLTEFALNLHSKSEKYRRSLIK